MSKKVRDIPDDDVVKAFVLTKIRHLPKDGRTCIHSHTSHFERTCTECCFELGGRERSVAIAGYSTLGELHQALKAS